MESDPKLRPHYRRTVMKQTVEKPEAERPHYINKVRSRGSSAPNVLKILTTSEALRYPDHHPQRRSAEKACALLETLL